MHDHISLNKQHLTQNFHKKLKNQKKFQKPQKFQKEPKNLGLMRECMKKEKIRTLTKCFDLDLGQKTHG